MANSNSIESTLKKTCEITGAVWAICAERGERGSAANGVYAPRNR